MNKPTLEDAYSLMQAHLARIANPVIFELGMCDGYHTNLMLSWCQSQPQFYGFEPDPRNINKIRWSGLPGRISFYPDAVGHITGKIPFHLSTPEPNGATGSSSISEFTPVLTECWSWLKCQEDVEVQCWRLDDFCAQHQIDHIDFIWMDVQGAERLVFDGGPLMLPKTKMVWTEYDGGTMYKDSSNINDILARFPGWEVLADCGGDVLLKNPAP